MSKHQLSIPKGTSDFLPPQMVKREYIFSVIKGVFQCYGFLPIETPAMEKLSVLSGKYGDEGEKLMFKVLNSGNYLGEVSIEKLQTLSAQTLTPLISEKALRYDLTVPLARVIAMHKHQLQFPFKRYQIQPVWRADRPQKGRFREFFQCDVDIAGSDSLLCEAELIKIIDDIFFKLGLTNGTLKINHRKILSGICEIIGQQSKETQICIAIDKYDKTKKEGVFSELTSLGLASDAINTIDNFFNLSAYNSGYFNNLKEMLKNSSTGLDGISEVMLIIEYLGKMDLRNIKVVPSVTLARGLNYYTGAIFETVIDNISAGSVSGGGRYDKLIGMFGDQEIPAVGLSLGIDRIFDVVEELNLFPNKLKISCKVMFVNFDKESTPHLLTYASKIRNAGISAEVYPSPVKIKKQMEYADNRKIPYVILIGADELKQNKLTIKDMQHGTQQLLTIEEIIKMIH